MGVPTQRHTKGKRNQRRMHIFLKKPTLISCPKCGKSIPPHLVCPNCGYYKGREVINLLEKLEKKERKKREKEVKLKEKEGKETTKEKRLDLKELSRK